MAEMDLPAGQIVRDAHGAVIHIGDRIRSLHNHRRGVVTRFEAHRTVPFTTWVYAQWDHDPPDLNFWIEPHMCELLFVEKPPPDPNDMSMFDLNETEETDAELGKV